MPLDRPPVRNAVSPAGLAKASVSPSALGGWRQAAAACVSLAGPESSRRNAHLLRVAEVEEANEAHSLERRPALFLPSHEAGADFCV